VAVETASSSTLRIENLYAGYFGRPVVHDVSLAVQPGAITALLGHNGAGKTTTLKAIAGLIPVYGGSVSLHGEDITRKNSSQRVKRGLFYLPQERATFATMTVRDNLRLGATLVSDPTARAGHLDQILELFPVLAERIGQIAGTMSGGQQRMLSMGIGLMAGAKVLLLDEPSLGLAPTIIQQLLQTVRQLCEHEGLAVLLVEQAVGLALEVADHIYVMRTGQLVADETRESARAREHWWELF